MAGLKFDLSRMISGLAACESKADIAIRMLAEQGALQFQNSARENRKWIDRTGHAKQRITGSVAAISRGYRIYLAHGVDYGIWLELAHGKRFAIIPQTIEYVGTFEIMPGFEKLIERLG